MKEKTQNIPVAFKLAKLFWKLGPAYSRWVEERLKEAGTTPHRLRAIQLLCDCGPISMKRLADELGVTSATMTGLIDALEKDGRVTRVAHPSDRRISMIELTPQTKERFSCNRPVYQEQISKLFDIFSKSEQAQLLDYLTRIQNALVESGVLCETRSSEESVK